MENREIKKLNNRQPMEASGKKIVENMRNYGNELVK